MRKSIQQKMFKAVQRWQQSGLMKKAWCEKNNIAYATFHYCIKQYCDQVSASEEGASNGFIQLVVDDATQAACWCEKQMPNGKKLVFHQPVNADLLRILAA
jgi:hypothetical protein